MFAYPGIEIADLCSYPFYRYMRFKTEGKDFLVIKKKIVVNNSGKLSGLRNFPKNWNR